MKVGIIGAGGIAKSMIRTIAKMEDTEVYAIASRDIERAEAYAKEYGIEKYYGNYQELLENEQVELVYIATPHSHHYEHAKLCIEYGKPILCEKAFMANAKQAQEVLELAREKRVFITEAIWTRFMPSVSMIKEVLSAGEIGEVVSMSANLGYPISHVERLQDPALAGGALLDLGIYPIHFACTYFGTDIEEVSASCTYTSSGVDEQNAIIFKYSDGKIATLHSSMLTPSDQYGIIYGTQGHLVAKGINNIDTIEIYGADRVIKRTLKVPPKITGYEYEVMACQRALADGQIECEEIPHSETLFIMQVMDGIREQWGIRYPFE